MKAVTTIIIGAGQSGLAMSGELTRLGVDHLVLDRGVVANAWRAERWDSLRLLTPNWANALRGMPYGGAEPEGYMRIGEFVQYLERYAQTLDAPVQSLTAVERVTRVEQGYLVQTSQGPLVARTVVLANGACGRAAVPTLSAEVPHRIFQTTPMAYKRPGDLPEGGVLVVGASASGVQLAREVHSPRRPVTLSVGWHTRLPRTYRGHDVEWWLDTMGVLDERFDEVDDIQRARRIPSPQLIGGAESVDLNALQNLGIDIVGRLAGIRDGEALFSGGLANACASADLKMHRLLDSIDAWSRDRGLDRAASAPDRPEATRLSDAPALSLRLSDGRIRSIIWATGYRPDFSWVDVPVFDGRGRLRHAGGIIDAPGLYAMGLTFMRRRRSHQISGAGPDARDLALHLKRYLDTGESLAA